MTRLSRYFLYVFLSRFAWVFLLVHLFVALASLVGFLTRYPFVPITSLLGRLPELVLLQLPISLPFSALLGAVLFAENIRPRRGFLAVQLAGRDPRRYQWPILVVGLGLGAALLWLNTNVLPQVRFQAKHLIYSLRHAPLSLVLRMVEDPNVIDGYRLSFGNVTDGSLEDFALLADNGAVAVTARRANVALEPDSDALMVHLTDGRCLSLNESRDLDWNFRFDRMTLGFDAASLCGPPKTKILDLQYYSNAELGRLPEQERFLYRRGIRPSPGQRLRAAGAESMRAMRWQWAALPLLFVLLAVVFLGRHRVPRRRTVFVTALCLCLLLPLTILLDLRARQGRLATGLLASLPTVLTLATIFLAVGAGRIRPGIRR